MDFVKNSYMTPLINTELPQSDIELTNKKYVDDRLPVGTVVMFGDTNAPNGWLICDGTAVSRTTYSDLFTVIGTAWGEGDTTTTFNLPDLTGAFPVVVIDFIIKF